jgi:hypothetical protein
MKVHVSVFTITLLFSLGGLSAGGQAAQENKATPVQQGTSTNASGAKRHADLPVRAPATKEAETPSPAPSPQQTVSPNLEESLVGLTKAVTKLVDKQAEQENVRIKFVDLLTALAGLVMAIVVLGSTVFGVYKHKPQWLEKNKQIIMPAFFAILVAIVLLGLVYLLSGVVTALLNVLIAIIILLIATLVTAVHLITFIDEHTPPNRTVSLDVQSSGDRREV